MRTIILCFLFLGLVFADIDLSKEQKLYQVSPDEGSCTSLGFGGDIGGEISFSPLESQGVKIVGSLSLGNKTLTCARANMTEAEGELPQEIKGPLEMAKGALTSLDNRVIALNCSLDGKSYRTGLLSAKAGTMLIVNECAVGLNKNKVEDINDFLSSGVIKNKTAECPLIDFSGKFSIQNIVEQTVKDQKIGSVDILAENLYIPETKKNYTDALVKCVFIQMGSAMVMSECEGADSKGEKVEFEEGIAYVPFDGESLVVYAPKDVENEDDPSFCMLVVLYSGLLRLTLLSGLLVALWSFMMN